MSGYSQHIVEYVSELLQLLKTCTLNENAIASFIAQLLQVIHCRDCRSSSDHARKPTTTLSADMRSVQVAQNFNQSLAYKQVHPCCSKRSTAP